MAKWPTLTGRQKPHNLRASNGDSWQGEEVITLGRRAGTQPMPWQCGAIMGISLKTPAGTWVHQTCVLIVPRQNGKSLILSLLILYRIFVCGEKIIYTAHEWKSAEEIANRTWEMIDSRPWLSARVAKHNHSQGQAIIFLKNGAKVFFRTRSAAAGRGVDEVDTLIFDEGFDVTDAEIAALGPTQNAAKDPQIIYASSAVDRDEHRHGMVLSALREEALGPEPDPTVLFMEWMAPDDMDRMAVDAWAYSNPSFGVIHNERKIRNLMRNMITPAGQKKFDVEALGRGDWYVTDALVEDDLLVIDLERWASLADSHPEVTGPACLAIDASNDINNRTWSVAVAVRTAGGIHAQLGFHGQANIKSLAAFVAKAVDANDTVAVVVDPKSAAAVLIPELIKLDIEPQQMNGPKVSAATLGMLQHVDDATLTHDNDPHMVEALAVARLREVGDGGVAWARRKSDGTICQLVAMTNAVYGLDAFDVRTAPPADLGFIDNGPDIATDFADTLRW
ncbi:hypothetical protein INS45_01375 [Corynebacterium aurimucosum]|nr:hypothetical protein [Corynebacterium aurimucosum]